jgi:thiol-disulfide isomerase/thioredoxin
MMNNRREWLVLGGVAMAAAAAGGGWKLWRQQQARRVEIADAAALADSGGLWGLSFPQPGGGELSMAALRGRPLVLNFWATWCPPCVKEMPQFDRFARDFAGRGFQVVGLAIDGPTPVREYLAKLPVSYAIGLAGLNGAELGRQLGNERGALPFTVVFDAQGRLRHRKLGETDYAELAAWAGDL